MKLIKFYGSFANYAVNEKLSPIFISRTFCTKQEVFLSMPLTYTYITTCFVNQQFSDRTLLKFYIQFISNQFSYDIYGFYYAYTFILATEKDLFVKHRFHRKMSEGCLYLNEGRIISNNIKWLFTV